MKKILLVAVLWTCAIIAAATEQTPDLLIYNGKKYSLSTGWGHPSPLQTYFSQNQISYPFSVWSTANYRGHVATWEIKENKFFLKEIQARDETTPPAKYNIKSRSDSLNSGGMVYADWFTGVLSCYLPKDNNKYYYFYVRQGEVVNSQILTQEDFKKISEISEKDTTNHELMDKYMMLLLNENYISYYFRLASEQDHITLDEETGQFAGQSGNSPLLEYFGNDPLQWPYNWENYGKTGAPSCNWEIVDDKLYLSEINIVTGTGFYESHKVNVPLEELFNHLENDKVFADWLSGIYIIKHGKEENDELLTSFTHFKVTDLTYIRVVKGMIGEKYKVAADFFKNGVPEHTQPGLKKMLEEIEDK